MLQHQAVAIVVFRVGLQINEGLCAVTHPNLIEHQFSEAAGGSRIQFCPDCRRFDSQRKKTLAQQWDWTRLHIQSQLPSTGDELMDNIAAAYWCGIETPIGVLDSSSDSKPCSSIWGLRRSFRISGRRGCQRIEKQVFISTNPGNQEEGQIARTI